MIDRLSGIVQHIRDQAITLEVGGIGWALQVPQGTMFNEGQALSVYVYMHWNQEQGPTLFGFSTEHDRQIFSLALSCSGIGPRLGLAILADLGAAAFVQAVREGNERALSAISGIGAKKAEQIIIHLKHKCNSASFDVLMNTSASSSTDWYTTAQTLESLGYSRLEVTRAIAHLRATQSGDAALPFDQLVRKALSFLTRPPAV